MENKSLTSKPSTAGAAVSRWGDIGNGFDQLMRGFFVTPFDESFFGRDVSLERAIAPKVDIAETEKEMTFTAELPGIAEKDVELTVAGGVMTIKGAKTEEKEETKKNYHLAERRYGFFQRAFTLPDYVDQEKIVASFDKGVLRVVMPKIESKAGGPRRIKIASH